MALILSTLAVLLCARVAVCQTHVANENEIIGRWYMGTMTGKDCNLELQKNHMLRLQERGCFQNNPGINSSWKLEGQKIMIEAPSIMQSLGKYLLIANY